MYYATPCRIRIQEEQQVVLMQSAETIGSLEISSEANKVNTHCGRLETSTVMKYQKEKTGTSVVSAVNHLASVTDNITLSSEEPLNIQYATEPQCKHAMVSHYQQIGNICYENVAGEYLPNDTSIKIELENIALKQFSSENEGICVQGSEHFEGHKFIRNELIIHKTPKYDQVVDNNKFIATITKSCLNVSDLTQNIVLSNFLPEHTDAKLNLNVCNVPNLKRSSNKNIHILPKVDPIHNQNYATTVTIPAEMTTSKKLYIPQSSAERVSEENKLCSRNQKVK